MIDIDAPFISTPSQDTKTEFSNAVSEVKQEDAFKNYPQFPEEEFVATPATPATPEDPPAEEVSKVDNSHKLAQLAKAERRMAKQKAEAEQVIKRASEVRGAFETEDVIEALTKLGLKPEEIYRKLTDHAIKNIPAKIEEPKDPIQQKIEEQEKRLKAYEDKQSEMEKRQEEEKTNQAHYTAMTQHVAPVINEHLQDYEVLIDVFGSPDKVIQEVYREMYTEFQRSGSTFTAKQAADAMEQYFTEQMSVSLEKASKMNRFQKYFNKLEEKQNTDNNASLTKAERFNKILAAHTETKKADADKQKSAKTLTNNMSGSPIGSNNLSPVSAITDKDKYIEWILKNRKK